MEAVLELYAEPYDPKRPVVCFDERPCQLTAEVHPALAVRPGTPARQDYEYQRNGTCNLFMFFQPLAGWRHAKVTPHRKNPDFAQCMKELVDTHFPDADVIRVVLDNLSTHTPSALYATFPPEEARRITRRLEFHYTPKHGSWLNMVEIELAVAVHQCLKQRIPTLPAMQHEVTAWATARNAQHATVHWRFTVGDARAKLKRLYPS